MTHWRSVVAMVSFAGISGLGTPSALAQASGAPAPAKLKGFALPTGEGTSFAITGNAQFRYAANLRDTDDVGDRDDFTHGFSNRRVRLGAQGTVLDPNLSFRVDGELATAERMELIDVFLAYRWEGGTRVRAGQFKVPLLQEELNSHTRLQTVERSIVNAVFTQNYSQGVEVSHAWESFRVAGAFSDGLNTINTDFDAAREADWALTGRAEWKWAGEWPRLDQFTSWRGSEYAGFLGFAGHVQSGGETGARTGGTNDVDVAQYTADLSIKGDGWNVFLAFVGRNTDSAAAARSFDDFGLVAQGGLFVSEEAELFLRYDHVFVDDDRATSPGVGGEDFASITAGVTYYFSPRSHAFKVQAEVVYFPDSQADAGTLVRPSSSTSVLASGEAQGLFRVQTQIVW